MCSLIEKKNLLVYRLLKFFFQLCPALKARNMIARGKR